MTSDIEKAIAAAAKEIGKYSGASAKFNVDHFAEIITRHLELPIELMEATRCGEALRSRRAIRTLEIQLANAKPCIRCNGLEKVSGLDDEFGCPVCHSQQSARESP